MGAVVVVENLVKTYLNGRVKALNGISFSVERGEIFTLVGPNGAGKTTTVEILEGLRKRDSGTVSVLGMDPGRDAERLKNRIGVCLQVGSLPSKLRVRELIELFANFYSNPMPTDEVLRRAGLLEKENALFEQLSGGQKQRLNIALALVGDPEIVFLDEPTTGLDPGIRAEIWEVILGLKKEGKTVILTTHYMEEAEKLSDRVAFIDQGKILAIGTPRDLIERYCPRSVVEFRGDGFTRGELERIPGVVGAKKAGGWWVLSSDDAEATLSDLVRLSASTGKTFAGLTVKRGSLDDVFLMLTGKRLREGEESEDLGETHDSKP